MQTNQHFFRSDRSVSDGKGQKPSQTSAGFVGAYEAQALEIVNAITAVVFNAEAALNWLRVEPPDLEKVRRALNGIVSDGKRAAEIVIRLRELTKKLPTCEEASDRR